MKKRPSCYAIMRELTKPTPVPELQLVRRYLPPSPTPRSQD
jgi:hypothetical protein